jgi:hypothetical protein
MKKQYPIELTLTNKMWKHFKELPFEKDGELALPTKRDNSEDRYLNNFVEIGLLYEVLIDDHYGAFSETTFYLTHVGKLLLKQYK